MRTARLKDFVEINPTVRLAKAAEYPFVPMEAITPGRRYVEAPGMRAAGGGAKFCGGDTLFARITPCLENGKIAQFKAPATQAAFGSTEYWVFRARENVSDPAYVFYLATSEIIRGPAEKSMSGASGRQRADIASVEDLEVPAPDLPTQRRIASILSAYDDLIENNTRRIAILEEMARRIYEEWFVRFRFPGHEQVRMVESELGLIPEGWMPSQVGECVTIHRGKSYKSTELADEGGLSFVNLKCMERDGGFRKSGLKRFTGSYKETQKVTTGDLVMAVTDMTQERRIVARCGRVPRLGSDFGVISMDLVKIEANKGVPRDFVYGMFRWSGFADEVKQHANGANVLHLSPDRIAEYHFTLPPSEVTEQFAGFISPMLHQCDVLLEKNEVLRATRDLLLPKLISGELDVSTLPEPEEAIEA